MQDKATNGDMRIGLFLIDTASLFQNKQKEDAESAARTLNVSLHVDFAGGKGAKQREQIFAFIRQTPPPVGVIVESAEDTGLRFVALEALRKGIAWALINRKSSWVADVALETRGLAFCVLADQEGIGRDQSKQYNALLPRGGTVLCITGPTLSETAQARLAGMEATRGASISIIQVVGDWTEKSGYAAVKSWLETTRGYVPFHLIGAQNDDMAVGGRKAAAEMSEVLDLPDLRNIPAMGVDGMPEYGIRLVNEKTLAATVIMPPTTGKALEQMVTALRGGAPPPPITTIPVTPYPEPERIVPT
jgi:ABC-type sugar transport system substrate-binding protein